MMVEEYGGGVCFLLHSMMVLFLMIDKVVGRSLVFFIPVQQDLNCISCVERQYGSKTYTQLLAAACVLII